MTENSFVAPLKKWGNSFVLTVPPEIAKLYKITQEMEVIIKPQKRSLKCPSCGLLLEG